MGSLVAGLTYEELLVACKNVGINLDCGGCAANFYTGVNDIVHDKNCTLKHDSQISWDELFIRAALHRAGVPLIAADQAIVALRGLGIVTGPAPTSVQAVKLATNTIPSTF